MKNVFIYTQNVKQFKAAMMDMEKVVSEPVLSVFYGQAGRGKTSASQHFAAQEGWTYCRALRGWSELWFLQSLCFELKIEPIPKRKKPAFEAIQAHLNRHSNTVVIDEADKMGMVLLDWVRDLADLTCAPFALVGERELLHKMRRERRIWSRTLRAVEFGPITTQDIMFFARQAAGLALTADMADMLCQTSEGDFRLVSRDVRRLEEIAQTNNLQKVTVDTVRQAVKEGLRGE